MASPSATARRPSTRVRGRSRAARGPWTPSRFVWLSHFPLISRFSNRRERRQCEETRPWLTSASDRKAVSNAQFGQKNAKTSFWHAFRPLDNFPTYFPVFFHIGNTFRAQGPNILCVENLEISGCFNAGGGSSLTREGTVEMEAAVCSVDATGEVDCLYFYFCLILLLF